MSKYDDLPRADFAFPGPLRDLLVSAILDGSKTATTSIAMEYRTANEAFPQIGARQVVIDSAENAVAVIETTGVEQARLADVQWEHARDEGEGYSSAAEWRAAHERFWHSQEMRSLIGDPSFTVDDDTIVVLERFRRVELL
ncbi:MAG: ASCH domain-containing protein [Arthrobacter sp.]|nr:ASCH domain-containing protein [Arthrobacter sp.]